MCACLAQMEAAQKAPQSPPGETKPLEVLIHNVSHKDLLMTVCRAEHEARFAHAPVLVVAFCLHI